MKSDAPTGAIVAALRKQGASVTYIDAGGRKDGRGMPDLLVGFRADTFLLEVKSKLGKLEPSQVEWHRNWHGRPVRVITSKWEAFAEIGIMSEDSARMEMERDNGSR